MQGTQRLSFGEEYLEAISNKTHVNYEAWTEGISKRLKDIPRTPELNDVINDLEKELKEIVKKFKEQGECNQYLQSKIHRLESRIDELEADKKSLECQVKENREKIQEMENRFALGQVTWLLEQNLAMLILPENEEFGLLNAWGDMHEWLDDNEQTPKGKQQKQLLIDILALGTDYEANFDIYRQAMRKLRKLRNPVAHPDKVSLNDARSEIQRYLPRKKKECLYIIMIVEKLNCLMKLGKLASSFQEDVASFVCNRKETRGIQAMTSWLRQNTAEDRRARELRERWMYLTDGKDWTKNHDHVLEVMVSLKRKSSILQDVELDTTKKYIVKFVPEEQKDPCIDIINTMKKLNGLRLGQLAFNFQENLVKYVIHDGNQGTVVEMIDWLETAERTASRNEAAKRWKNITGRVVWTQEHTQALTTLVALKGTVAISESIEIDKETAMIHMVDCVPMNLIQKGIEIVQMADRFRREARLT